MHKTANTTFLQLKLLPISSYSGLSSSLTNKSAVRGTLECGSEMTSTAESPKASPHQNFSAFLTGCIVQDFPKPLRILGYTTWLYEIPMLDDACASCRLDLRTNMRQKDSSRCSPPWTVVWDSALPPVSWAKQRAPRRVREELRSPIVPQIAQQPAPSHRQDAPSHMVKRDRLTSFQMSTLHAASGVCGWGKPEVECLPFWKGCGVVSCARDIKWTAVNVSDGLFRARG